MRVEPLSTRLLPTRLLCLVPEAAEIVAAIGCEEAVVVVAGADALRRAVEERRPDLIVTSETASGGGVPRREARRIVRGLGARVPIYALEPRSVGGILSDVKTVGDAIGRQGEARALIETLRARIDAVSLRAARLVAERGPRRVAGLVARDPPTAAGWWQAELIGLAGGLDVLDGMGRPPRRTTWAEIDAAGPELVVLLDAGLALPLARERGDRLPGSPSPSQRGGGQGVGYPRRQAEGLPRVTAGSPLTPGPGVVDVLERLAALLHPGHVG